MKDAAGKERTVWEGGEIVQAIAYDNPIPGAPISLLLIAPHFLHSRPFSLIGFDTWNTINLRLFRAAPSREFDLASFNTGAEASAFLACGRNVVHASLLQAITCAL